MVNSAKDTPDDLIQLQRSIVLSKTPQQRALMGIDMINVAYQVVKNSILNTNPNISEGELIALIFERYYSNDFTVEKIAGIKEAIIAFHNRKL